MSARSRKLQGSLGESWGDAEYDSDGGASVQSASEFGTEPESENESDYGTTDDKDFAHHHDIVTPLPPRVTRASSREPDHSPVQTPARRQVPRHSQSPRPSPRSQPRSSRPTPGSGSAEPSFIMPSMYGSPGGLHQSSSLRNPQPRLRKPQRSTAEASPSSVNTSSVWKRKASTRWPPSQTQPAFYEGQNPGPWHYVSLLLDHFVFPVLQYTRGVIGHFLMFLQPFLGVGLGMLFLSAIIFFAVQKTSGMVSSTAQMILSPFCIIPGSSFVLPFCGSNNGHHGTISAPAFDDLMGLQSDFEDIITSQQEAWDLPTLMKDSEGAIRDVRTIVRHSKLPSRRELEVEFDSFIQMASQASEELINWNAKVGGTMDKIINTNKFTRTVLHNIEEKEGGYGIVARIGTAINPLSIFRASPPTLPQRVYEQYIIHVGQNKDYLESLIVSGLGLDALLKSLENRLDDIANIAARDGMQITRDQDELLSHFYTWLGGNAATRKGYERQLNILRHVVKYRKEARKHIGDTLQKLREMAAGLENLREAVAAPEVLGFREEFPLGYLIDGMDMAIERLESTRRESIRAEREHHQRVIHGRVEEKALPAGDIPMISVGKKM